MYKSIKIFFSVFIIVIVASCSQNQELKKTTIQDDILTNKKSFFYIDVKNYPKKDKKLPIGIFDSGTGGLTVLDAIVNSDQFNNSDHSFTRNGDKKRDFDEEAFIYLGDKANMPYGEYAGNNKTDLLKEHVIKDMQFLLGKRYYRTKSNAHPRADKQPIKALVIACNTATAYGKNDIEAFIKRAGLDLKVIGVIGAGVRGALETIDKNEDAAIGIMATAGTVASNGYPNTVIEQKEKLGYTGKIESYQQAGIGLAAAVDGEIDYLNPDLTAPRDDYRGPSLTKEKAKIDKSILNRYGFDYSKNHILLKGTKDNPTEIQLNSIKNYIAYHVISLLEKVKASGTKNKLKGVILGCTHYPFFMKEFQAEYDRAYNLKESGKYVYRNFMAKKVKLIDPAVNTAKELYAYLDESQLFNNGDIMKSEFYISVPNILNRNNVFDKNGNFTYEYKYGRKAGYIQEYVKRVPFSRRSLSNDLIERLSEQIPFTFKLIESFDQNNPKTEFLSEKERI
ncbi:Glutamate racemase [hydrothermal vent metagenome]|uniref:Glutamate racemase n=1 Tax=hydrothermal vent metagenome TaxID=652676 RepID=A0A3B1CI05_9ZZZZ